MPPKKIFKLDTSQKKLSFYLESVISDNDSNDAHPSCDVRDVDDNAPSSETGTTTSALNASQSSARVIPESGSEERRFQLTGPQGQSVSSFAIQVGSAEERVVKGQVYCQFCSTVLVSLSLYYISYN